MKKIWRDVHDLVQIQRAHRFQKKVRYLINKNQTATKERILIWIPPRPSTNLGDTEMIHIIDQHFAGESVIYLSNNKEVFNFKTEQQIVYFDLGSGKKEFYKLLSEICVTRFILIGADMIDGAYSFSDSIFKLQLATTFQIKGVNSSVVNSSWNGNTIPTKLKRVISRANKAGVRFVIRDVVSQSRLKGIGLNSSLSADLVFGLEDLVVESSNSNFSEWYRENPNFVVVGVGNKYRALNSDFLKIRELLEYLLLNSYSVALCPTNYLSEDIELNAALFTSFNSQKVFLHEKFSSGQELLDVLRNAKFGISNRMHFIIHAALVAVPVFGIEYQGKFRGLYESLGIKNLCLSDFSEVLPSLKSNENHLDDSRREIKKMVPSLRELSRVNLEPNQ